MSSTTLSTTDEQESASPSITLHRLDEDPHNLGPIYSHAWFDVYFAKRGEWHEGQVLWISFPWITITLKWDNQFQNDVTVNLSSSQRDMVRPLHTFTPKPQHLAGDLPKPLTKGTKIDVKNREDIWKPGVIVDANKWRVLSL